MKVSGGNNYENGIENGVEIVKLHDNEREIDDSLVRRLLGEQFPQWADLPMKRELASRPTIIRGRGTSIDG